MNARGGELDPTTHSQEAPCLVSASDGYARWAATYDSNPNPLLHREERYLAALLPAFAGKRMLDLACGTGRWLQTCIGLGLPSAFGIDISEAMLRNASLKPGLSRRIALADCLMLPFGDGVFDLTICSFAVWHIANVDLMASEIARVTKPHGVVFVSDLHPDAFAHGWRTGFRDSGGPKQIETHPLSIDECVKTFADAGLECVESQALGLEQQELPLFTRAGKAHMFEIATRLPAVAVFQFQRAAHSA